MRRFASGMTALLVLAAAALANAASAKPGAIDLPGDRLFPENVTSDGKGHAYFGSVSDGIFKVTLASGRIERWLAPGTYGSASIFGLLVDPVNGLLWTCNNDLSAVGVPVPGADKGSTLKGFDLVTGEGKFSLQLPENNAFCNDMTVADNGIVYVTDSNRSHILRWEPGALALEDWFFHPALADPANNNGGLDGIAIGADGDLYVNNWRLNRLARVEVKPDGGAGAMTILETSRPLAVPDGMRHLTGMTFALAEGGGKVALFTVTGDTAKVRTLSEGFPSAAGLTIEDGVIWYVPGELSYVFNPQRRGQTPPLPFRLTPVALP